MGIIKQQLIKCAEREWRYFGESRRDIEDRWHMAGNEVDEPFRSHISHYWKSVGNPDWNGATDQAWSGAFISWCFEIAGAGTRFYRHGKHSKYIDRIRRHDEMSELLLLRDPTAVPLAPGDLIWNSRQEDPQNPDPDIPATYAAAIDALQVENFFVSHVDIVVSVADGLCESIGGNVWGPPPLSGGSVVRSTWRLNNDAILDDDRKDWIGVVKNGL